MINRAAAADVVALYKKHGWLLRRVLLSLESEKVLGDTLGGVPISRSSIDAAWFSRPPQTGSISWEIRYLGDPPFALVESFDENDAEFELDLRAVEERLHEKIAGGDIRLTTAAPDSKL